MIDFIKKIKAKLPFLWNLIDFVNEVIVQSLYGKKINRSISMFLPEKNKFTYRVLQSYDLNSLEQMLGSQPEGFDRYFKPHDFNLQTINSLFRNRAFLMMGAFIDDEIVGYFFIRFFANGTAFRGKMVDASYQGKGIAKEMGTIMTNIALNAGFRLFATISKSNYGSLASSAAVNQIKIIKELPDNYIYIEYGRKC